jgi:hypothetical protein
LSLARTSAEDATFLLNSGRYVLNVLKDRPLIRALVPDHCDPILRDVRQWFAEFANLSTIELSGQVLCNANSEKGQNLPNYRNRDWFGKVFGSRSFTIGAPVIGGTTGLWVVPLVQPIFDDRGNMTGALSMTVDLARFKPKLIGQVMDAATAA